jgi:hypothetical protein
MRIYKKSKKFLSFLLALTMILSIWSVDAAAKTNGSEKEILSESQSKDFYKGPMLDASKRQKLEKPKTKSKLDSKLLELTGKKKPSNKKTVITLKAEMKSLKQFIPAGSYVEKAGKYSSSDLVYVYIKTKTSEGISSVEPYTFKVDNIDPKSKLFTAWVEVTKLAQLELLSEVEMIQTVIAPKVNVASEGDEFHRTNLVRSLPNGSTGKGIKIGVISDGVDHLSESISSGALNSQVAVLSNTVGGDEGTAMLEIVHALAPDASLYFHDCGNNVIAFNQAVDDLIAAGCNIIVDDIGWILEPFFEDGVVASHIKEVINSRGIIYVSAAGNSGSSHFIGQYHNDGYNFNDFSSGTSSYTKSMYLSIEPGETAYAVLQWNDPFNNSNNDYDLYLYDTADFTILDSSEMEQAGNNSQPLEYVEYTNNTNSTIEAEIDIYNYEGLAEPRMLNLYIYGNNYMDNVVSSNSIFGHPAVPEVITTAAIHTYNPTEITDYSSQGPVLKLNGTIIQKPDISGAAGVTISGSGGFPTSFSGTSAAAPHIAAIAALLWSLIPSMTNTEVRNLIQNNAVDLGTPGYDNIFGYGKADAYNSFIKVSTKPKADIYSEMSTYRGFKVQLNGAGSTTGKGISLTYNWKLETKPLGSSATLSNPSSISPYFTADVAGDYRISLSVNDGLDISPTVYSTIKVKDFSSTSDDIDLSSGTYTGGLYLGSNIISIPVPLTDGWIITADDSNKVKILNVLSGSTGKEYQLSATPNALDFDFDKNIIIASLIDVNKIAVIDIIKNSIYYIDTPFRYKKIEFGENNLAFALTNEPFNSYVSVIDINTKKVLNTANIPSESYDVIAYEKVKNALYLGVTSYSPSALARFSFDEITGQLKQEQYVWNMGGGGRELVISPDGNSLAFVCGGGNGGYNVFDIDSSDITKKFGVWNVGAYPTAAAFSPDDKYIAISNGTQIKIFDRQNHYPVGSINRSSTLNPDKVLFSRGGKILYDFHSGIIESFENDFGSLPSVDYAIQPIVLTQSELIAYKGFKIGLDGKAAASGLGLNLYYKWSFDSKPSGSQTSLVNSSSSTPYFTADAVGDYRVRLIVSNGVADLSQSSFNIKIKDMNSTTDDINVATISAPSRVQLGREVSAKPIPLTDGWIISADNTNKIKIVNIITGDVGKQYQLSTAPSAIDFDFEKKLIIASLSNTDLVALINTTENSISYIRTPFSYKAIVYGEKNMAFALSSEWPTAQITLIDTNEKRVLDTIDVSGQNYGLIAYDKEKNALYLGVTGFSPSSLARFSFDEVNKQLKQGQIISTLGSNGQDLDLSPDGKHIAFSCGSGNGSYDIYDIDSSDLTNKFGIWYTGPYPNSSDFSLDSRYIVTSNGYEIKIFDVQSHNLINTISAPGYGYNLYVMFSRGGKLAFSFDSGNISCFESGITQNLLKGDLDYSGSVTIPELQNIASIYNTESSSIDVWKPELDLNNDSIVDIFDLVIASSNIQ